MKKKNIKEIFIYLLIINLSIFATLYTFEYYLIYKKDIKLVYDNRSNLEVYKDLKKNNKNIRVSKSLATNWLIEERGFVPFAGVSKAKTLVCNENGYWSIVQSDRYGFNNPDTEWNKDQADYVLLGDSFIYGSCVNRPYDISSVLRDISGKTVINLGIGGTSILMQYAILREYSPSKIKNLFVFYYEGNDNDNLYVESKKKLLKKYITQDNFSQNLKKNQDKIDITLLEYEDKKYKKEIEKLKKKKLYNKFLTIYYTRNLVKNYLFSNIYLQEKREVDKSFEIILKKLKNLSTNKNLNLYFVYLPENLRYYNKSKYKNKNYNNIKEIVDSLNIEFVDIKKLFDASDNVLSFFSITQMGYGHYSIDGYKKVAEEIYNKSLLPLSK